MTGAAPSYAWALDLLILGGVAFGLFTGYRRGALLQLFSWGGFVVGLFVGGLVAPILVQRFAPRSPSVEAILGIVLFLGIAFLTEAVIAIGGGKAIGRISGDRIKQADRVLGAAVAAVMAVASAWVLSVPARRSPQLAASVKNSVILRALPQPPDLIAGLGGLLNHTGFPEVFQQLNPSLAPGVEPAPAELAKDREILEAARRTFKIESEGCGGLVNGSGFSVTPGYVVTAAHVVAGTTGTEVLEPTDGGGARYDATPVYVDARKDIAILHVPDLPPRGIVLSTDEAARGVDGAAIGYPGGGPRTISVARVRARTPAMGRDIYSRDSVNREIYVLRAHVQQGNSGGPFVDAAGRVRGLIFAASAEDSEESYALTEAEILTAMQAARGRTGAAPTGACAI